MHHRCVAPLAAALLLACQGTTTSEPPEPGAAPPEVAPSAHEASPPVANSPPTAAPSREDALAVSKRVADAGLARWPDPDAPVPWSGHELPSHTWSRAVFFEGLADLIREAGDPAHRAYAEAWAEAHAWGLDGGPTTRFADSHAAGQVYLELWEQDGRRDPRRVAETEASVLAMAAGARFEDWTWVDALHMAMPLFARVAARREDPQVHAAMLALYTFTRNRAGGGGLWDPAEGLFYRDAKFLPPFAEPNGRGCFWSRGNGWAITGLARALDALPPGAPNRALYEADFRALAASAVRTRRADGFWNVSLEDAGHFGGPELTGTALFVHALAWGVRTGLLPREPYRAVALGSYEALAAAVRDDGTLAWVQGPATQPSDRQPVTFDTVPMLDDFAVGCFLLAGTSTARLLVSP